MRIQSIFSTIAHNIKAIFDKKSLINFGGGFEAQFQSDVIALENYITELNNGRSAEEAFNLTMRQSSIAAQEFANSLNATARSEEEAAQALADFAARQSASQVTMMAQNRSLSNVRTLLNEYNSGMQNCGLTQQQFRQSVGESNSILGNYLGTVNVGNATMKGYIGSLISAKVASIGLRIATTALNAVIGAGIGLIVSLISSGVMALIEYVKENTKPIAEQLKDINDKLKETKSAIKEISDKFQELQDKSKEVIPRFAELAKGVDRFGKNVSLTDEEYEEFLQLNNKIAAMFPELNLGMDDSGNAMLNLSYSADTLTESLKALVEAQREQANQDLAKKLPDLVKDTKSQRDLLQKEIDGYKTDITNYQDWLKKFADGSYTTDWNWSEWDGITKTQEQKVLDSAGVKYHREIADTRHIDGGGTNYNAAHDEVKYRYVIDDDISAFERAMNDYIAGINNQIANAEKQIENSWQSMSPSLIAWMKTNSTFESFGENLQQIATTMLANVDWSKLGLETDEEITGYIEKHILDPLSKADFKTQDAFDKLVQITPDQFGSVEEYTKAVKNSINEIANMSKTDGLTFDTIFNGMGYDKVLQKYQDAIDGIKKSIPDVTEEMINSLSPSEVIQAFNNVKSFGISSWEELQSFIESQRFIDSFHLEDIKTLKDALGDLKDTYDDVSSIIDNYNKNKYYSIKDLKSLLSLEPEYINTLINEKGQLDLNSQAYRDYVAAKAKTLVVSQIKSLYESILSMTAEEAQAYANAEAFKAETRSLGDLISATTQYYLILAKAQDTKNHTTNYTDALKKSFGTVANYAAIYDSWLKSLSSSTNEFTDKTDKTTKALKQEKTALEHQKKALEDSKKVLEHYKKGLDEAKDSLQDLIDLVIDYIKQMKEDEKEALEEQKSQFDDLISKRKEALELAKKEREEADKLAEKQNSVVKSKLALSIAELDDSAAGKKVRKKAEENLKTANKDLTSYLSDREYDARVEALEKEQKAFDDSIDSQTKKIDEYLKNSRQLYEDACKMIENDTGDLYEKLWSQYVYPHTTKTKAEFDNLWSNAQSAIQKYLGDNESLIDVMNRLQGEIYNVDNQTKILDSQIDDLSGAIDSTNSALDSTSGVIDAVATSLDGLGSSISDYMEKLNQLANMPVGDNANKTSFWVNYNGKKYETGYNYNGDTKGNRLLAASELTKLIAKDVSGFENYGLSQVQALLGVGGNETGHKWTYKFDGKTYESRAATKTLAVADIRSQLAKKYGNSSFVLDQVYGKITGYAEGTKSATGGLHIVDEEGLFSEFIPYQIGKGRYSFLPEGNPVFSKAMTNTLFDFAKDPAEFANSVRDNSSNDFNGDINLVNNIYGDVDERMLNKLEKKEKELIDKAKSEMIETILKGRKWR